MPAARRRGLRGVRDRLGGGVIGWLAALAAAETPLTLGEVLASAEVQNGGVAVARLDQESADARVLAAKGVFDPIYAADLAIQPSIRIRNYLGGAPQLQETSSWALSQSLGGTTAFGTGYTLGLDVSRTTQSTTVGALTAGLDFYQSAATATLSQQLLRGARMRWNLQNVTRNRQGQTRAALLTELRRQEALRDAVSAYWTWVGAEETFLITQQAVAVAEEAQRVGRLQVERGQLAPVEGTRLEAALVSARQDELEAFNEADRAEDALLLVIGRDPRDPFVPATEIQDVPAMAVDVDKVVEVAKAQNLELAVARLDAQTASLELGFADHQRLPQLALVGTVGAGALRCPPGSEDVTCSSGDLLDTVTGIASDDNLPFVSVGGAFRAPLGNRAARGTADAAGVALERARRVIEDLQRDVVARVEVEARSLVSARSRMELADANLALAEQTLAAEEALAAAGRSLQRDVLLARSALQQARVEAALSRTDYRIGEARLLALQGLL